jgi:hypothetical protein
MWMVTNVPMTERMIVTVGFAVKTMVRIKPSHNQEIAKIFVRIGTPSPVLQ